MNTKVTKEKKVQIIIAPIIFIFTVFLFLIRFKVFNPGITGLFWYTGSEIGTDLYSMFKMQTFLVATAVGIVVLIMSVFTDGMQIYKHRVYIPMVIYCVFVLLSYSFSDYKQVAMVGYLDHIEGTAALIGYMVILFYTMNAVTDEKQVKLIFNCFAVACTLLGIWGVLQLRGVDIDSLPQWLYVPSKYWGQVDLGAKKSADTVRWFFGNQNHTSFFIIMPICIFAMTSIATQSIKIKVIFAALTGFMFFNLLQAYSLGGMVAIFGVAVFAAGVLGVGNIKKMGKSIGIIAVFVAISVLLSLPAILGEVKSVNAYSEGLGIVKTVFADDTVPESTTPEKLKIDYIKTEEENVTFSFVGNAVTVETDGTDVTGVVDAEGKNLGLSNRFMNVESKFDDETKTNYVYVTTATFVWNFALYEGEMYYVSQSGMGIKLKEVENFGFKNNQGFATYRGYIWSRTLPLIKDTLFIGHGADTFPIYFPQDDYAGRYNIGYLSNDVSIMVDKPHSMYLGTAVNTGVISLVALLAVYGIYLWESFKLYRKREFTDYKHYMGLGLFIAIVGIMIDGLINDSMVSIMPVVYCLMGIGFALNRMIKNDVK
ncbi:MAG: O-antigen ligase family protein [Anaerotignaceae bacterium]